MLLENILHLDCFSFTKALTFLYHFYAALSGVSSGWIYYGSAQPSNFASNFTVALCNTNG